MEARYRPILPREFRSIPQLAKLDGTQLREMSTIARVLPFKANNYIVNELIDWDKVPDDPVFSLIFPHREMLPADRFLELHALISSDAPSHQIEETIHDIRSELNPHPADQLISNVPSMDGSRVEGLQHKYRETVLFFPKSGQTCHAYCAFCFRWPQFIDDSSLRMALADSEVLAHYLRNHNEVSDVLITGGDPLTMSTRRLATYLQPFLRPELEHVQNIRIGTKALSFWPGRFVVDNDADELLRLIEQLIGVGKHIAVMAHFNHPVELSTNMVQRAIRRILSTGAQIRSQSPVLRHVNDSPKIWSQMWREQVRLGIYPYYMFVARDTGAKTRFDLPLGRTLQIYQDAVRDVSGLARTARGPSMSMSAGKVEILGTMMVDADKAFVLSFIQARDPSWVRRPFLARFDESATWFDELTPLRSEGAIFFARSERSRQATAQ
jgi:KamA family protein